MTVPTEMQPTLDAIERFDRPDCLAEWRRMFGGDPPPYLSVSFMRRVLLWKRQCELDGDVSSKIWRTLERIADGRRVASRPKPGAELIREWNGRIYRVRVTEHGFEMEGARYRSLSAIAKRITGAHWSGPRFFGLD